MESNPAPSSRSWFDRLFAYLDRLSAGDRFVVYVLAVTFIAASFVALLLWSVSFTSPVPTSGGTLIEGMVGTPRFVNPALAITRTDSDITALMYSGLMRLNPEGVLVPDLAESVTVSDDGLVYNIALRDDVRFHDDTPIRAEDVAFTIDLIQDPGLKSPLRGDWTGVTVEVLGEHEMNLVLNSPYAPFMENLTVGIMPKHIWEPLTIEELPFSQHNTEPVGSGPYELANVTRNKSGFINRYMLRAHEDGRIQPNISGVTISFFTNERELAAAFEQGDITSTSGLALETLAEYANDASVRIIEEPLPRIFSVFFNQNRSSALRDESVRQALTAVVDREALIDTALGGFGTPVDTPIPVGMADFDAAGAEAPSLDRARTLLVNGGWEQSEDGRWTKEVEGGTIPLAITVATANTAVFEETAYYLEQVWGELGVEVGIELYEQSDLVQSVIRPRNYQALLFGTDIGRALDLYPFWHSSQREDPGLNVALYANITTDTLLETARTTQDASERLTSLSEFATEIAAESPALFLFSPSFTYALRSDVETTDLARISRPHERFANIRDWYMHEESVWPVFVPDDTE